MEFISFFEKCVLLFRNSNKGLMNYQYLNLNHTLHMIKNLVKYFIPLKNLTFLHLLPNQKV